MTSTRSDAFSASAHSSGPSSPCAIAGAKCQRYAFFKKRRARNEWIVLQAKQAVKKAASQVPSKQTVKKAASQVPSGARKTVRHDCRTPCSLLSPCNFLIRLSVCQSGSKNTGLAPLSAQHASLLSLHVPSTGASHTGVAICSLWGASPSTPAARNIRDPRCIFSGREADGAHMNGTLPRKVEAELRCTRQVRSRAGWWGPDESAGSAWSARTPASCPDRLPLLPGRQPVRLAILHPVVWCAV